MFAYCNNNPVNLADPNGSLPWYLDPEGNDQHAELQFYTSANSAAAAFYEEIYGLSSYVKMEYVTEIYSVTVDGSKRYYYTKPCVGTPHKSYIHPQNVPDYGEFVAYAHTHPNSNNFSKADIDAAKKYKVDAYVMGPNLKITKYSFDSGKKSPAGTATIRNWGAIQPERLEYYRSIWENYFVDGKCPKNYGSCTIDNWPNL